MASQPELVGQRGQVELEEGGGVAEAVESALAPDPTARPATALDFIAALQHGAAAAVRPVVAPAVLPDPRVDAPAGLSDLPLGEFPLREFPVRESAPPSDFFA